MRGKCLPTSHGNLVTAQLGLRCVLCLPGVPGSGVMPRNMCDVVVRIPGFDFLSLPS